MGLFSGILSSIFGGGGSSSSQSVTVTQQQASEINVNVNPQIGIAVDTAGLAAPLVSALDELRLQADAAAVRADEAAVRSDLVLRDVALANAVGLQAVASSQALLGSAFERQGAAFERQGAAVERQGAAVDRQGAAIERQAAAAEAEQARAVKLETDVRDLAERLAPYAKLAAVAGAGYLALRAAA